MAKLVVLLLLTCPSYFAQFLGDEAIYTINTKKALHSVSERFISVSVDPAVLLTGLNLSDTSLDLAKHFGPAFIRIAGPSTQFVKYVDIEEQLLEDSNNVVVTPSMWFGINEWLTLANLTPVFGINDIETTSRGVWNPKSAMPLLEISDKLNVTCHWQLGYDCSNKTEMRYKEDLLIFRHILDAFPDKRDVWKVVGSDLSKCSDNNHLEHVRRNLEDIQDTVTAVVWEPESDYQIQKLIMGLPLKPRVPFWTVAQKDSHPVSFASAIAWAHQIGEAAKNGYEVIFRELRVHEMFSETPAYWVSALHKALMGRNVLDVKMPSSIHNPQVSVYAHCTKHQNNFIRSGAMTVLMVNNGTIDHTVFIRFGTGSLKNAEVQSYVLTSPDLDSTDVYLNGNKLSIDDFGKEKVNILPKLRRARVMNYLSLTLPPKAIGFFVLPTARVPVCVNGETEMNLLMEEIYEDQNIPFSKEVSVDVNSRFGLHNKQHTLRELQNIMEKELESDERYYSRMHVKKYQQPQKYTEENNNAPTLKEARNFFIERAKLADRQRKQVDNDHKRLQFFKEKHRERSEEEPAKELELELTSSEIRKILTDRAKVRAAKKNIVFSSQELEEIMNKATEKFLKNRNTSIKLKRKMKRDTMRDKKDINMKLLNLKTLGERRKNLLQQIHQLAQRQVKHRESKRTRRDINLDLLKLRTDLLQKKKKKHVKNKFEDNEEKLATIRGPDQSSEEFISVSEGSASEDEDALPNGDVYAELAKTEDIETSLEKPKKTLFKSNFNRDFLSFGGKKPTHVKLDIETVAPKRKKVSEEVATASLQDFSDSDPLDSLELDENYPCIHEYFGLSSSEKHDQPKAPERLEFGEPTSDKKSYKVLSVKNRGFLSKEVNDDKDDLDIALATDYADLDSDEKTVKLKRSIDDGRYYYVIGKGYKKDDVKINANLKDQQYKILKSRLSAKKRKELIQRNNKSNHDKTSTDRKIRSVWDEAQNSFAGRYKSLTEGLRDWRPADMISLQDKKKFARSPNSKSISTVKQTKLVGKAKRSVGNNINSIENEIDLFMNEINKESKIIVPKLDMENGDYQLVFPNHDKIQVQEKNGDTELKLTFHGNSEEIVNATCAPTEQSNNISTSTVGGLIENKQNSSNVQKIPNKKYSDNVWRAAFRKITKFFQGLSKKLKTYILDDLLK